MDLRSYYRKVRDAEATLPQEHIVMVSLETSEGGKEGVRTEAPRSIAARLIAEMRARVATNEEASEFHEVHREARAKQEQEEIARRVQVMVLPGAGCQEDERTELTMALFVDGPACTIEDLTAQDSGLLDIAQSNGINVTTKMRLAQQEISTELQLWLDKPRQSVELVWGPVLRLGQIVTTAPLKRWEAMHALSLVYRDAYFSQLVDRYQAKWQEFSKLGGDAREGFIASGMGLVNDPLPRAVPPVLAANSAPQGGGTFYASVAWVNGTGQEGAASAASSITIQDGNLMAVAAIDPPKNATGFNVFAGTSPNEMSLQNAALLPVGTTYLYVPGVVTQGRAPGAGQAPDYMRPLVRAWLRG